MIKIYFNEKKAVKAEREFDYIKISHDNIESFMEEAMSVELFWELYKLHKDDVLAHLIAEAVSEKDSIIEELQERVDELEEALSEKDEYMERRGL